MNIILLFLLAVVSVSLIIRWRLQRPWADFTGILIATAAGITVVGYLLQIAIGITMYAFGALLTIGTILVAIYYFWRHLFRRKPTGATMQ